MQDLKMALSQLTLGLMLPLFASAAISSQGHSLRASPSSLLQDPSVDVRSIVAQLVGELERFNNLYVVKLERELTSTASRLSALESSVRAVSDRALAWDNIQNHMAVWTDQSRTMERKLDILNRCHEKKVEWESKLNAVDALNHKLTALDNKINAMTRLEFKVEQVSERVEEVDSKVSWLQKQEAAPKDSAPGGVWAEFAGRGLLTTLRNIEGSVLNITKNLSPSGGSYGGWPSRSRSRVHGTRARSVRHPHDSARTQCELDDRDARLLEDVSAKVDLVFDKLADPEEDYENFIAHLSRRSLPAPTRAFTGKPLEHHDTDSRGPEGDRPALEDPDSDVNTERIFAMFWRSLFAPFKKLNRRFRSLETHLAQLSRQCLGPENRSATMLEPPIPQPQPPQLTSSQLKLSLVEALSPFRQMVASNHVTRMSEFTVIKNLISEMSETVDDSAFRAEEESSRVRELLSSQHKDLTATISELQKSIQDQCAGRYDEDVESLPFKRMAEGVRLALLTEDEEEGPESANGRAVNHTGADREETLIPTPQPTPAKELHEQTIERRRVVADVLKSEVFLKSLNGTSVSQRELPNRESDPVGNRMPKKKRILGCNSVSATGIVKLPATSSDADPNYFIRYCDQTLPGGGWTTIQRRGPKEGHTPLNFSRSWQEYKEGFGDLAEEFWWGNDFIHRLSEEQNLSLRFDLWDFEGNHAFAQYSQFRVGNESTDYQLTVSGYHGNSSDSFSAHSGFPFSTFDRDNDRAPECCPCAPAYGGGWWFFSCFESNLNGEYHLEPEDNDYYRGLIWELWKGDYSLKSVQMSVKPTNP